MDEAKSTTGCGGDGKTVSLNPLKIEDAVKLVRWMIPSHFAEKLIESEQKRMVDEISLLHGWPRGVTTFGETIAKFPEDANPDVIIDQAMPKAKEQLVKISATAKLAMDDMPSLLARAHFNQLLPKDEKMRQMGIYIGEYGTRDLNPIAAQQYLFLREHQLMGGTNDGQGFEEFIAKMLAFKQNLLKKTFGIIGAVSLIDFHHAAVFAGDAPSYELGPQFSGDSKLLMVSHRWPEQASQELQEGKVILNAPGANLADVIAFHRCQNDTLIVDCVQAKQKGNNASLPMKTEFEKEITKTDDKLNDQVTEELKERFGVSEVKYVFGLVSSGRLTHGRTDMSKNENMESVLCEIMEEQQPKMIDAIYAVDRERLVKWAGPPFANRAQLFSYKNSIDLWNQCAPESGRVEYAEVLGYKGESVEEMGELCKGLPKWKERNGEE
eukprot:TRINITY_DN55_c0_g1_i10.p1 TRINITY_DN55_c0_g1~~TRINITY_DN55_c0_g1_i10.p1  ORF type:complete len:438 (-),score=101.16 TRINITY_DN55_c0_g1_i10:3368-4681(-)